LSPLHVEPFEIAIPERTLSDLRERIGNTRWPPPSPEPGWEQGAHLSYMRGPPCRGGGDRRRLADAAQAMTRAS
jgi:hypothetical protein